MPIRGIFRNMARRWEEFTEPGTARIAHLHVSISRIGTILISRNAHEALRKPTHVVLLWDGETDTIGIRSVPPRTINAFQLYPSTSGECRMHARRFLLSHQIAFDYTVRFPTAIIEEDVLILEIKYRVRSPRSAYVRSRVAR